MAWVDGANLGRNWSIGPQYTLYLPGCWLREGVNEVGVMDIEPTGNHMLRGVTEFIYGPRLDSGLGYACGPGEHIALLDNQNIADGTFEDGDKAQVLYADSEEPVAEPAAAGNVLDEQPVTFLHPQYRGAALPAS